MRKFIKPMVPAALAILMLATHVHGSFYKEDWMFSLRPDENETMRSIDRFGPVGIGIELHQPAFVMKIGNIEDGSPAAETGQLQRGQIIETINGERLQDIDPRIQLGNIITQAEAKDGIVELVVRDNKNAPTKTVTVDIPVLGSYSENWPLDCEKSDRIVRDLAAWASEQRAQINTAGGMRMLFLLSTGEEEDLAVVRDWIRQLAQRYEGDDMIAANVNWNLGYGAIAIAEYYIRTGDQTALPLIQGLVRAAEHNYMPGGWSTRGKGVWTYMGGGRMSAAGLHVATFLLLAQESGVDVDEVVLQGGLRQFIRYAGRGNVAYGDQRPETGHTDNGKNGAMAFTMAAAAAVSPEGEDSMYAKARDMSAMRGFYSTHWMLHGHTGGGVGEIWRSAAMGLMHGEETGRYRSFMDNRTWFYELSRRFDGSFGILDGDYYGTTGRYDNPNWGITMGLTYTIPRRTLRISGAPPTEHSHKVSLPAQIWGTEADNDFYVLTPATPAQGNKPDVQSERLDGNSGRAIMARIADGDEGVVRKYMHHPEFEMRRSARARIRQMPALVMEALQSDNARVRDVGAAAIAENQDLLTDETIEILLAMIHDSEESWWVVDRALQALTGVDPDQLAPHIDRILYWAQHEDWWMSSSAMELIMPVAARGHEPDKIMSTVGRVVAANRRFRRWRPQIFSRGFEHASPEVQQLLLETLSMVYQSWPKDTDMHQDPTHPGSGPEFIQTVARAMAAQDGGLDQLYTLSQERYPERTLAHRELFLGSDRIQENPEMQARLIPLTRDELIPEYVVDHAATLWRAYENPDRDTEEALEGLVELFNRIEKDTYDWHDYGPERTEMEGEYHTFDPIEQPPVGQERRRLGRYRDVTYPEGMEHWNQPAFDAEAAGWRTGLSPFASLDGELRAVGGCNRHEKRGMAFCGCGEEPNTLWEKEVLLKRGVFEIPPFEDGYLYRILIGGTSHVGYGDGTHVYVNGQEIYRRENAIRRRAGARPIGTAITREWWSEFESGQTHLAAKSFLKYYPQSGRYGNYLTVFLRRMEIPPLWDNLVKGLELTEMRDAEWQILQDPDSNVDPDDGRYLWDGQVTENPDAVGAWHIIDQVDNIEDFDPQNPQRPSRGWSPLLREIELTDDLRTSEPLFVWTGSKLLDVDGKQALRVEQKTVQDQPYLFVEAGGFSPDHTFGWTAPWLVFEKQ